MPDLPHTILLMIGFAVSIYGLKTWITAIYRHLLWTRKLKEMERI